MAVQRAMSPQGGDNGAIFSFVIILEKLRTFWKLCSGREAAKL